MNCYHAAASGPLSLTWYYTAGRSSHTRGLARLRGLHDDLVNAVEANISAQKIYSHEKRELRPLGTPVYLLFIDRGQRVKIKHLKNGRAVYEKEEDRKLRSFEKARVTADTP